MVNAVEWYCVSGFILRSFGRRAYIGHVELHHRIPSPLAVVHLTGPVAQLCTIIDGSCSSQSTIRESATGNKQLDGKHVGLGEITANSYLRPADS
jgi:hypothetical protein